MRPSVFKALQLVVSTLGVGTLRLKQPANQAESIPIAPLATGFDRWNPNDCAVATIPEASERKLQTVDLLVRQMGQIQPNSFPNREWDSSRAFSLQLVRLARGIGPEVAAHEPVPDKREPESRQAVALAIGFAVAQQNRLRQVFASTFQCELDFVTFDAIAARQQEANKASLILINIASVAVTKRLARQLLELAESGRPTLFTGSRTALKSLGVLSNRPVSAWDFLPVPWDRDELVWRVLRLMQREPLALVPPKGPPSRAGLAVRSLDTMRQAC